MVDLSLLTSVLVTALHTTRAIERFARYTQGPTVARAIDKDLGVTEAASVLAKTLLERDAVNGGLIDELVRRAPDQTDVIRRIWASTQHDERAAARARVESIPVPHELSEWAEQIKALEPEDTLQQPTAPDHWLQAAAVLRSFDPVKLKPVFPPGAERSIAPRDGALTQLASVSWELPDGRWELKLEERQATLARIWSEAGTVKRALDANPEPSLHAEILRRAVFGLEYGRNELVGATSEMLEALALVGTWLEKVDEPPFDPDLLTTLLERQETVGPLRRLAGKHFRGRAGELERLASFVEGYGATTFVLSGIGGVGKSALLGKFLLDHEQAHADIRPWAYLDFDAPEIEGLNPRAWTAAIARQLNSFYTSLPPAKDGYEALESLADEHFTQRERNNPFRALAADGASVDVDELLKQLRKVLHDGLSSDAGLLVVFDTFEQVQARGSTAVRQVRQFIKKVREILPEAKCIVSVVAPSRNGMTRRGWRCAISIENRRRRCSKHSVSGLRVCERR